MATAVLDAIVAGAGVAGLAAALELQSAGCDVLVVDPADRPGGVLRTDHRKGYVFESGPNTTLVKAPMRAFLARRGLEDELLRASPASKRRFIYREDGMLEAPSSLMGLARTPIVSFGGKLRALSEPLRRKGPGGEESVSEFVSRRLGGEVAKGLVGPFLTGVYAGDEDELGASAVFPGLVEHERRHGSIVLGGLVGALGRRKAKGLSGSYSTQKGFGPFARRIAELLNEPPALGSRVSWIARDGPRWHVDLTSPSGDMSISAARVVIATPAYAAADVLRGVDGEVATVLEGIDYAPIVAAPLGIAAGSSRVPIEGFGFLVPREAKLSLLGCLFMNQLFPGRAPAGHELLHCMLGGVRWPEAVHLPDAELHARLAEDLEKTLGLRDTPEPLALARWPRAIPQPRRDHADRIAWIQGRLDECPGLALAGAYVAGVSVADSLASGLSAAERALAGVPFA